MTPSSILVVGSTGLLGGEVVRQLRSTGHATKALVRKSSDANKLSGLKHAGAETVVGDLRDPRSLSMASEGATAVISTGTSLLSGADGDSIETVDLRGHLNLIAAAEAAKVGQFIFISFPPSPIDHEFQRAKRAVEARLEQSSLQYTIIQAASFAEVWLAPFLGFDPLNGHARIFGDGTKTTNWLSLSDVAKLAVASLDEPSFARQTLTLGGPEALSYSDVLELFAKEGYRTAAVEHIPEAALEKQLRAAADTRQQAFAAAMLGRARGQNVSSEFVLAHHAMQLTSMKEFVRLTVAMRHTV